jgi:hypothetical protein
MNYSLKKKETVCMAKKMKDSLKKNKPVCMEKNEWFLDKEKNSLYGQKK